MATPQQKNADQQAVYERYIRTLGFTKVTLVTNGVTMTDWIKAETQPAASNGRPDRPVTWTPALETTQDRTSSKPSHATWKKMDTRNWYRVGAPWHTCPNCTIYETVQMQATTELVANEDTGKVTRVTTYHERRVSSGFMANDEPKPVNGMNLYRSHTDGHDECMDCGWVGPVPAPDKRRRKPKTFWLEDRDANRGARIEATGKQTIRTNHRSTPAGQRIDKRAMLAAYLAAQQKENGK